MYDRSLFLKLNNYGYSDEDIEEVKNYLTNQELPNKIDTNVKAKRYDEKWNQFEIRDNKLFYKKLDLEVVPNNERNEKMKDLYENEITGPGRGIEMFLSSDILSVFLRNRLHLIFLYSNIYHRLYDRTSQSLFPAHLFHFHTDPS